MAHLDKKFTPAVVEQVRSLLQQAARSGERTAALEKVQAVLTQAGLWWKERVPPEMVGVHPQNRSGLMLDVPSAHAHGADIVATGFSKRKSADATALEAPSNESAHVANTRLQQLSNGLLPPLAACKLLSIGGSHTNAFLRAVKGSCPTSSEGLKPFCVNDHLNVDALCVNRPELREAIESGLEWSVLHRDCDAAWPGPTGLVALVQGALNTTAASGQGEVEIVLSLDRMRANAHMLSAEPDWASWQAAVRATLPKCSDYVSVLATFVKL